MELAKGLLVREAELEIEANEAIQSLKDTQKILSENLRDGELGVAGPLVKTHEIEFRRHGLFEKDNRQKASPVTINISLDDSIKGVTIDGQSTRL